ncbi:hypothetical protein QFC21_002098 [Naganishia friedmannii]|uniref:Uncharacterized protein n=1 Tax=Naganishia friedmannii TaxID=89922 RepID=A0ACC2VZT6_9TREE|nr:hypothetical protein QFC21_002098 [Naganishia friedmannii]
MDGAKLSQETTASHQGPPTGKELSLNKSAQYLPQPSATIDASRSQPATSQQHQQGGSQLTDKQKAQMFIYLQDEVDTLRKRDEERMSQQVRLAKALREARKQNEAIQEAARTKQDYHDTAPIVRSSMSRGEAREIRLTNARELLGLRIDPEDVGKGGAWTYRLSRLFQGPILEAVTDTAPVWKKIHRLKKKNIIIEFAKRVKEVPCLKGLFYFNSPWDQHAGPEISQAGWTLREVMKVTMNDMK